MYMERMKKWGGVRVGGTEIIVCVCHEGYVKVITLPWDVCPIFLLK